MTLPCSRFFKIILRKNLEDGNLKIPNKFTRKYGGDLPNPMFLKPPDGTEWKVCWTKNDAGIWVQEGWKEFAKHYSLEQGQLLVFEYEGTSQFEVHIFDTSSVEIEYPCIVQVSDQSVEILAELSPCQKKGLKCPMSPPQPHKKLRSGKTRGAENSPSSQKLLQHVQTKDGKSTQRASPIISQRSRTTGNMEKAAKFTSESPSFVIDIRQNLLKNKRPGLSVVFAKKYFYKKKQNVMIQYRKKLWPATVTYNQSKSIALLSSGWSRFAKESKLQTGDACVFELINREDSVLKLHILRGHN